MNCKLSPAAPKAAHMIFMFFITIIVVLSFFPFIWMILNSFKTNTEIFQNPLSLPQVWDFGVFQKAWIDYKFGTAVLNSVIITASVVVVNVIFSSLAAFATSHLDFSGKNLFLSFCIGCQVVSGQILLVPLFKLLKQTHLYNSRMGLILVMTAFSIPMSMYLFNSFFKGLPREIFISSKIDGCNNIIYFYKILMPLSTPIISSVVIFQAMFAWNEYLFALTFLRDSKLWTVPPLLRNLFSGRNQQYNLNFASLSIVVVPILILYIFLQKYFIRGLTAGSVIG